MVEDERSSSLALTNNCSLTSHKIMAKKKAAKKKATKKKAKKASKKRQ